GWRATRSGCLGLERVEQIGVGELLRADDAARAHVVILPIEAREARLLVEIAWEVDTRDDALEVLGHCQRALAVAGSVVPHDASLEALIDEAATVRILGGIRDRQAPDLEV